MNKILFLGLSIGLGLSQITQAQISSDSASKQLTNTAKQKVIHGGINLDALLRNDSNDIIIEYEAADSVYKRNEELRHYIAQRKQNFRNRIQSHAGFELLRDYNALPISFHRIRDRSTLVQVLNDPNVKAVYPNRTSYAVTAQSYELIGQKAAASNGFKGDGTTVAVLDTGANYRHGDFGGCSAPSTPSSCRITHSVEIASNDYALDSSNGHGSNVAGIVSQVAPNTKIAALDVFTGDSAYDSDIISGLNWVINNAKTLNIKAVNLSLGSSTKYSSTCTNSSLTNSFNNLRNVGVIPVVASGNNGFSNGISYPACTVGAVSVGAVYDSNIGGVRYSTCSDSSTFADKVTCFSNSASILTVLAPGSNMNAGGSTQSGTSQATPHIAAAIAVLRASNAIPNETLDQTIARITSTGTLVSDHRNGLRTPRLNLIAALNGVNNNPTSPAPQPPVTPQEPVLTPTPVPVSPSNCRKVFFITVCNG